MSNIMRGIGRQAIGTVLVFALGAGTATIFSYCGAAFAEEKKTEKHPEMHKALTHLHDAKKELEKSAHDYDGHRVEAIKATDLAISEVEHGLASDKK